MGDVINLKHERDATHISQGLTVLKEMNRDRELSCVAFVGLNREGDHVMGVMGDNDVDILVLLDVLRDHATKKS